MFLKKQKSNPTPDLHIRLSNGQEFSIQNLQKSSTIFEVKQAIEKLKGVKLD